LGLRLAGPALECRLFVVSGAEAIDDASAHREFAAGRARLDELLAQPRFASVLSGLSPRWELFDDYGNGAIRLCSLSGAGRLLWDSTCPQRTV
jgi:hypothetical protein